MAQHLKTIWEVADRNGKLGELKEKLGLRTNENVQWSFEKLGRRESSNVFKVELTREAHYSYSSDSVSFVLKWNDNVHIEFNLLTQLYKSVPVPKPIYLCDDWSIVGEEFMVMEYVEGLHYNDISEVPAKHLKDVLTSVVSALSVLHSGQWKAPNGAGGVSTYQSAEFFWRDQVAMWTDNYRNVVGWSGWNFWPFFDYNPESYFFSKVQGASKPQGTTTRIHGSLDIGNVIFDVNFEVKAIIDWKYKLNGDPMVDLAYFLMVCLPPSPSLAECKLLLPETQRGLINDALKVYKQKSKRQFSDREFSYARAVCCLRCISIIKKAADDHFKHHEIGNYRVIKNEPEAVINFLHKAGREFYDSWKAY